MYDDLTLSEARLLARYEETMEAREDAITDRALDLLAKGERLDRGGRYMECPGCDLWVHHSDTISHVKDCDALRTLAEEGA